LQPQGLLRSAEQQEQHSTEKWVVYDSYQIQPWDSPTEVVSLGLQGVMMGSSSVRSRCGWRPSSRHRKLQRCWPSLALGLKPRRQ
jgi:hypothetical protein